MHDHDHNSGNHLHFHPSAANVDKVKIVDKISKADNFKGFDDFMYFAYKYWIVIQESPEDVTKTKETFLEIGKKFKKFKDNENIGIYGDGFVENMTKATQLMSDHNLPEVTTLIEKFIKPYTLADKFIRNFNKRVNEA